MQVTPWWALAGVLAATGVVRVVDRHVARRRTERLRRLAEDEGYRYSAADRFGLAVRVRDALPGGGGRLSVRDLMYRSDPGHNAYAFTALVEGEHGGRFVVAARDRPGDPRLADVRRADPALPLVEQYRRVLHAIAAADAVSDVRPADASGR